MKAFSTILLYLFLLLPCKNETSAQNNTNDNTGPEIGLDFLRINNALHPFGILFHPDPEKEYNYDFIPSLFFRHPFGKNAVRLKYEYFQTSGTYIREANDYQGSIEGKYSVNRIFCGMERYIINGRFKAFGLIDFGFSFSDFKGKYSSSSSWTLENIVDEPQKINSYGISLNPGIGIKYQLSRKVNITLESSLGVEKFYNRDDPHRIQQKSRLTLRPLNLFGISYLFIR